MGRFIYRGGVRLLEIDARTADAAEWIAAAVKASGHRPQVFVVSHGKDIPVAVYDHRNDKQRPSPVENAKRLFS